MTLTARQRYALHAGTVLLAPFFRSSSPVFWYCPLTAWLGMREAIERYDSMRGSRR